MRIRRVLLALLVLFLWPAAARASVALCGISGQVFNPDGSTLNNGTVNFNSQVTQVVGSTTIPPSIISTTTDASGNMAPMSVAQGLFGTFTFCQGHSSSNVGGPGGGCAAAINGLIPINTTANIQSIIAGTLLPSVGNATVNNLTATNNVNVGGTMQTQTLLVNANSTLTGNATIGGTLGVTGAMTAPALSLTQTACSPLTLAQAVIGSTPPEGDFTVMAGAHCNGSGATATFIADSNSALMFANYTRYTTTGDHNAGWQWIGNTGLTPGSTFTPTVTMALGTNPADSTGISTVGTLTTNSLILQSTATAIQLTGGSIVSANNTSNNQLAGGQHYNGVNWLADATGTGMVSVGLGGQGPGVYFYANYGLTVGSPYTLTTLGYAFNANSTQSGWLLSGSNPVAILQSNTNTNSDILEVLPQNQTWGQALLYSGIHTIGTNPSATMSIDAKGGGAIILNGNNTTGYVQFSSELYGVNNNHIVVQLNSGTQPSIAACNGVIRGGSTDVSGQVIATSPVNTCLVTFGVGWPNAPNCTCSAIGNTALPAACGTSTSTSQVEFYTNISGGGPAQINWLCVGV